MPDFLRDFHRRVGYDLNFLKTRKIGRYALATGNKKPTLHVTWVFVSWLMFFV